MHIDEDDFNKLIHYGVVRRSGRYPWGSGGNTELSTARSFLDYVAYLKNKLGLSDTDVARDLGISTTELRAKKSIAKSEEKQASIIMATRLKEKGLSNVAAAERMGIPESTYRTLIAPGAKDKADAITNTADILRQHVADKKYIDIGSGVENHMGVSETRLKTAVARLKEEGYIVHYPKVRQLGTGNETSLKVLSAPDVSYSEVAEAKKAGLIGLPTVFSTDNGRSFSDSSNFEPMSLDPNRLTIRYKEEGGIEADGVVYIRPGVNDLTLGGSSYAQVRIKVGNEHYIKGMAVYKDDLPEGIDIMFNTNKSDTGNKLDALKPLNKNEDGSPNTDLPFGTIVRPLLDKPGTPNEKVASVMNIFNEEGAWEGWSATLSSQVLSKQKPKLAKDQLTMAYERRQKEYDQIMELTNPTVRRKLLQEFADGADSAAVQLKAASLPRTANHVLLPIPSMSELEIYAPNYRNGERVVLVRHPHGGTFEIPELTVNNNHKAAKRLMGQARDAVGINHKVAERLSGADFDGDTVLVIPNNNKKIETTPALRQLKDFDPVNAYPGYKGMKTMTNTQTEMGMVSNLITDMTIRGAPIADIAAAVKHSMVVIDAEKHGLNYKQSAIDNNIKRLKKEYQTKEDGSSGASTLISRAKSREYINDRKPRPVKEGGPIDKATGKKMFVDTGELSYKTGLPVKIKKDALSIVDDANELSSGTRIESIYAKYSNDVKALGNLARKSMIETPRAKYNASSAVTYAAEVKTLNAKLNTALKNRPLERQAQIVANALVNIRREANPNMDKEELKKVSNQALATARVRTGAKKQRVKVTPTEWDAIQAGAISDSKLATILENADMDVIRELATPRSAVLMTSAKSRRAKSMAASGYTRAEIADQLGVSLSTLGRSLDEV